MIVATGTPTPITMILPNVPTDAAMIFQQCLLAAVKMLINCAPNSMDKNVSTLILFSKSPESNIKHRV